MRLPVVTFVRETAWLRTAQSAHRSSFRVLHFFHIAHVVLLSNVLVKIFEH